jgi:hypothetical protein
MWIHKDEKGSLSLNVPYPLKISLGLHAGAPTYQSRTDMKVRVSNPNGLSLFVLDICILGLLKFHSSYQPLCNLHWQIIGCCKHIIAYKPLIMKEGCNP